MRKISITRAAGVGLLLALVGIAASCRESPDAEDAAEPVAALPGLGATEQIRSEEVRDVWLAMADDPLHHMRLARALVQEGAAERAARELDVSASLFRWGRLYVSDSVRRQAFTSTAQELETDARRLRRGGRQELEPLDRTLSTGMDVMAGHHAAMALEEWRAGEHTRAALLLRTSADEVRCGFSLSPGAPGDTIERALAGARSVADRLGSRRPPDEVQVRDAVEGMRAAATGLGDLLDPRRP